MFAVVVPVVVGSVEVGYVLRCTKYHRISNDFHTSYSGVLRHLFTSLRKMRLICNLKMASRAEEYVFLSSICLRFKRLDHHADFLAIPTALRRRGHVFQPHHPAFEVRFRKTANDQRDVIAIGVSREETFASRRGPPSVPDLVEGVVAVWDFPVFQLFTLDFVGVDGAVEL